MKVTADAARRFLVARHLLAPARSVEGGPDAVLEVFRRLGSIQFDPLAVAGRNHDLVLHARVADYDPALVRAPLRAPRDLRGVQQGALARARRASSRGSAGCSSRGSPQLLAENADVAERVLERIRAEGPLSALDFERERGPTTDWFGMPTNIVRAVLEAYAVTGVLGLARRDGNRRYYDLLERLLPADVLAHEVPLRASSSGTSCCRATALTACSASAAAADVFGGLGNAKPDPRLARATRDGRRCATSSSSAASSSPSTSRACAASASSSARRSSCSRRRRSRRRRSRSSRRSIRSSGTATCSGACSTSTTCGSSSSRRRSAAGAGTCCRSLFRDRLVGRIEPRIDRAEGRVEVLDVWWEDGFAPRRADGFVDAMRDALRAYLRFAGATASTGRPTSRRRSGSSSRGRDAESR